MDLIYAGLLGVIQAITEFLPISSSGHLALMRQFLDFELSDPQAFDVSLHVGSLIAVIVYFWRDLVEYARAMCNPSQGKPNMFLLLIIAMVPAVIVGLLLGDYLNIFQSVTSIAIALILGGILFIATEQWVKPQQELSSMTITQALIIGVVQVLAFIPGVSRSGITIIAGMWQKYKRDQAATFSFLLAIPVLFAAGVKKGYDMVIASEAIAYDIFIVGAIVSAICSYFVIKAFLSFVRRHSLSAFGWYRIVLGIVLLLFTWF